MSCLQKTKLIGPILLFNIFLPTWDVFSDFKLSMKLFIGGNQSCSIEEENVQEFRKELDSCLQNPQEYCQSGLNASYLCHDIPRQGLSCMNCSSQSFLSTQYSQCITNSDKGILEIDGQCLNNDGDYCSNPKTFHGICEKVTRRHYKFGILLLGKLL